MNQVANCCISKPNFCKNDPVPLKSISVDVRINGFLANVQSTLCYTNVEQNPIEARYEFPMDDQSTVYHFEAQIEDRIIIAECQEKEQAKETYEDALKERYSAVLMQESDFSSDVFSCLVGNLPPGKEAVIRFGYVTELTLQPDGILTFVLPTVLNPRYNPSPESGGTSSPLNIAYISKEGEQPYKFEVKATIINPGHIVNVKSAKDELNVVLSNDKNEAQVTLGKPFRADHDFSLDVTFEKPNEPHAIIERGNESAGGILNKDVIMLNFFPYLKESDYSSAHEFIFVVDRSGSMGGSRIEMAKETLLLFLKSLPTGCYFNVVGFGSSFELLFEDGSREYSEETLKLACEHQEVMQADLGGTEILAPLRHIYNKPPMPTHYREILLLTDGEVMNTQEVIDIVKKNSNNTRLFSFGIGEGASTSLVKGVARAGRGKAEFTKEGERLQPLVVKTLKAAMQLGVSDLHLDWQLLQSPQLLQLPKELPPLFSGEKLIVYAVFSDNKPVIEGKVQLKGKIGKRDIEFELSLNGTSTTSSNDEFLAIHRLAAKTQIKQLQDAGKDDNKAAIILLSTSTNIISCHTSMVGVDKNQKEKVVGSRVQRNVPMMHDISGSRKMKRCCFRSSRPVLMQLRGGGGGDYRSANRKKLLGGASRLSSDSLMMDCSTSVVTSFESDMAYDIVPEVPSYMNVVLLQSFSGEWKLTAELAALLNTTLEALQITAPIKVTDVWATVLALSYLEEKFSDKRNEWEMVEMKARQWLDFQDHEGFSFDDLIEKARVITRLA